MTDDAPMPLEVMELAILATPKLHAAWQRYERWLTEQGAPAEPVKPAFQWAYMAGYAACLAEHHPYPIPPKEHPHG